MRVMCLLGALLLASPALTSDSPQVRILAADGTTWGVLHLSPSGETLLLDRPDGSGLEVGSCGNEQRAKVPSPDATFDAVVVERNCGATVDFATRVDLVGKHGQVNLVVFAGQPQVKLLWKGGVELEVHHPKASPDDIYGPVSEAFGVKVALVADGGVAQTSKYLDFSSLNYGATGRAAGMPRELLLRLAGWSQEASGLYRAQWGTWFAQPPYGDDPRGAAKVREGIDYYEKSYTPQR
jgi:hypothetical protein